MMQRAAQVRRMAAQPPPQEVLLRELSRLQAQAARDELLLAQHQQQTTTLVRATSTTVRHRSRSPEKSDEVTVTKSQMLRELRRIEGESVRDELRLRRLERLSYSAPTSPLAAAP